MIDTIRMKFFMTAQMRNRLKEASTLDALGITIYSQKTFFIKPARGGKPIRIYFDMAKKTLGFECSLPKLLQGHNVCGSNKLESLCLAAIGLIYERLGLDFDDDEATIIQRKRIKLSRVDLACSFPFNSMHEAQQAASVIAAHLMVSGESWAIEGKGGIETAYARKNSRRVTDKFYLKGKEVEKHKLPPELQARDEICALAHRLLRFEVTYRAMELRRIGKEFERDLQYADGWSIKTVKQLLRKRIEAFGFTGTIRERLESEKLTGLGRSAKTFYDLYEQGADLSRKRSYAPLRKAREEILAHGVDIFRARDSERQLDLAVLLGSDRMKFGAPRSLTSSGAIISFKT